LKTQVVAVRKNGDGDIVELKLDSGHVVDYKNGQIENVNVFRGRDHEEHLRSNADGNSNNNLDNLPTF
jgi:autonomous glycyl radical cofactor GrcA